jgi:hypothetical protein
MSLLQSVGGEGAVLTLSNIMQILDEFVGDAAQYDDITCMIIRRS